MAAMQSGLDREAPSECYSSCKLAGLLCMDAS